MLICSKCGGTLTKPGTCCCMEISVQKIEVIQGTGKYKKISILKKIHARSLLQAGEKFAEQVFTFDVSANQKIPYGATLYVITEDPFENKRIFRFTPIVTFDYNELKLEEDK